MPSQPQPAPARPGPVWQLVTAGQWASRQNFQQPNKSHIQTEIMELLSYPATATATLSFRNIRRYICCPSDQAKSFIQFSFLRSVGTRVRSSTCLLQIWIDQLNHLPGLNGCWFFLAFLVVLRPPWVITSPLGGPHQQSPMARRNFSFQCKNFHGLILLTKQTLVVWGEIYSASLAVCLSSRVLICPAKQVKSEVAQLYWSGWQS